MLYYQYGFLTLITCLDPVAANPTIHTSYEPQSWKNCEPYPRIETIGAPAKIGGNGVTYVAPIAIKNIFTHVGGLAGINTRIEEGGCSPTTPVSLPVVEGGTPVFKTTEVTDGSFLFPSPVAGILEDIIIYLFDRTGSTPAAVQTPMDIYRQIK